MLKNKYIRLLVGIYLLLLPFLFIGCINEYINIEPENATLHLKLNIPPLKSMTTNQETQIDYNNIQVLVFEQTEQGELFRYQATISELSPPEIKLNIPVSQAQEKYRFVVIANANALSISVGMSKNDAMNQFVFDCAGKWNANVSNFSPIPMWGESVQPLRIKNDEYIGILMHRALARVDVGNLFKFNNPNPNTGQEYLDKETDKESVWGLENFKIKEIRIYRSLNKAYVASSAEKIFNNEVTTPNIPVSAKYNSDSGSEYNDLTNADRNPLVYTLTSASDSFIREIYIPESAIINEQSSADNVPCIVVGGYYGEENTTHITYYRADFATYNNGKIANFHPILRNHRYVFDIRSVKGPGFEEPELALRSISSDMILKVEEWNDVPLDFYVQGNYFFKVDTRKVSLESHIPQDETEIAYTFSYNTNLELNAILNPFVYEWASTSDIISQHFEVIFNYTEKKITFKAKQENTGSTPLSDYIILNVENFQLTIHVEQKAAPISNLFGGTVIAHNAIFKNFLVGRERP